MEEITIPYHLAVPAIISIIALGAIISSRRFFLSYDKWLGISLIVFFAIYLFIVGGATYDSLYCQWDLNRYDLDKDGSFGGQELTKEQEAAMERLTNDTGRNLSFLIGIFFSGILSVLVYILGSLLDLVALLIALRNNKNQT